MRPGLDLIHLALFPNGVDVERQFYCMKSNSFGSEKENRNNEHKQERKLACERARTKQVHALLHLLARS